MAIRVQVLVIGAGPGGYVAALRAGQLGLRTVLVERDRLGGECLNYGCIPSKALIHTADLIHHIESATAMGITAQVKLDMGKTQAWKRSVVERLTGGIAQLCKGYGVEVREGEASFKDGHTILVKSKGGESEEFQADNVAIATGSHPVQLAGLEADGQIVVWSKEALDFDRIPPRFLVVGGGITGLEIATMYAKLGSKVVVVELMDPSFQDIPESMKMYPGQSPET